MPPEGRLLANRRCRKEKRVAERSDRNEGSLHEGEEGETVANKLRKRVLDAHLGEEGKKKRNKSCEYGVRDIQLGKPQTRSSDTFELPACNFTARIGPPVFSSHILTSLRNSLNFVHYLYGTSLGKPSFQNKKSVLSPVARELDDMSLFRTANPFDRRTTALEWHPTRPHLLAAGSKGGDIILWDTLKQNINDRFIQGIGAGGSVQAMKFWPWNTDMIVTASIDGQVILRDLEGRHSRVLSDTLNCIDEWYCCVDVSTSKKVVVTGDNLGNTLMLSLDGQKLWDLRLHKQKVTHAEFCPRERWLLCTASVDHTVKMWDIRKVSGRDSALSVLKHDKPVNSAHFSRTDGCRLLTTDQHSQLRVYCGPGWLLENTISHPHRFFQHITPIKASWHPLQDLIVVGRYPDKQFPGYEEGELRTVDVFEAASGKLVSQLYDPHAPGIVSLNKFNARGDYLASGMGVNLLLWGRKQEVEDRQQSLLDAGRRSGLDLLLGSGRDRRAGGQRASGRGPLSGQTKSKKNDLDNVKMKLQTKTKTKAKNTK